MNGLEEQTMTWDKIWVLGIVSTPGFFPESASSGGSGLQVEEGMSEEAPPCALGGTWQC